ncbi:uncharacterized protein LOC119967100 isoform X7 [Scyliorhinus canicula]|uniref:uncharacterized protein LOC119967100 isoform X7 n=1 Tax=Scyliorhinus canicula TaxID=7830 RepID=UPI0018F3EDD5|nr:uncharacterized protein LOC119967100 isoform X7 [Scyliorhinus canicula]
MSLTLCHGSYHRPATSKRGSNGSGVCRLQWGRRPFAFLLPSININNHHSRQLYHWKVKNWSRFRSGMESKQHLPEKSRMINSYWPLLFFLLSETSEIGYAKPLPGCSCF